MRLTTSCDLRRPLLWLRRWCGLLPLLVLVVGASALQAQRPVSTTSI
jgi:hypothetical protein